MIWDLVIDEWEFPIANLTSQTNLVFLKGEATKEPTFPIDTLPSHPWLSEEQMQTMRDESEVLYDREGGSGGRTGRTGGAETTPSPQNNFLDMLFLGILVGGPWRTLRLPLWMIESAHSMTEQEPMPQ